MAGVESPALGQVHAWSQRFGGTGDDLAQGVTVDGAGNVLIVGGCTSVTNFGGGNIFTTANTRDIFLAKFDATGAHQWSHVFPNSVGNDEGHGVATDGSGNVFITGAFYNTVDFGGGNLTSAGGGDIFLAKYDAGGNYQWSKRFGTGGNEVGYAVAADGSGNVVVTGQYQGTVDFGGGDLTSAGGGDIFVAKFDGTGAHVWSKRFGSTQNDEAHGIDVDGSGNVVITGSFQLSVDFGGGPLTSPSGLSMFLAKYDANGVHQWSKRFSGLGSEIGNAIAIDAAGNVVVTGQYAGNVDFGGGPLNWIAASDCFIAKFDANGVHQWSLGYGGSSHDPAYGVAVDAAGNVAITGYFIGTANFGGSDLTSNAGSNDIFFARYSANGVHQWSQRFGNFQYDFGHAVAMNPAGDVFLAGEFNGPVDFGGGPLDNEFEISNDIILARFGTALTGIEETPRSPAISVAAYPNPFNPATTIRYTVTDRGRVQLNVYDASGKHVVTLLNEERSAGSHTVRWGGRDAKGVSVSSGVYFVSLEQNGATSTTKITLLK
jgi:hypothetical protein